MNDPTTSCPLKPGNDPCGYTRGIRYCSAWELCSEQKSLRDAVADLRRTDPMVPVAGDNT